MMARDHEKPPEIRLHLMHEISHAKYITYILHQDQSYAVGDTITEPRCVAASLIGH